MTTLIDHRKSRFDYEIVDTFEAGVELLGLEVKSLKNKAGSLDGSYVIVRGGEAYAINVFIPPYQEKNTPAGYDPRRNRRLILTKNEIKKLAAVDDGKNLTIVPISVYTKGDRVKVGIAIVRSKKKVDKRETIKKREADRDIEREMKGR
ncbi:SsrA-binding protein SmpB [Patescibacteria group bacterium]|nr:SsrA-binding protein SmpB [Patescibacteria group bacterium]MDE1946895.1 SsrA-binding protein SmpB [Patescibacteria group bacterium]MDE2010715.1 SsrA-binding protein SmpB [Patescibacteria group bacterium]MDE2232679.1 SsrA-binding protein SmpB [Patescibacteria group bacterium]